MININKNYLNLSENYLFSKISNEKKKYIEKYPNKKLIDLSIGDITLPLSNSCIKGVEMGLKLLSHKETFEGYPPSSGHTFLKEQIIQNDYFPLNVKLDMSEIFISDSSKSDIAHILDIFESNITVAIQNPVYPVYLDSNIIRGNKIKYIYTIEDIFNFDEHIDIFYLCSPNNPTGEIISKENLEKIVNYAIKNNSIIFFDGAYESFIQSKDTVHSIYEIKDAKKVAIEFRSYSKSAGFTPLRLAYTIVPHDIKLNSNSVNATYKRLKDTKYNGPSFLSEYAIYNTYKTNALYELKNNINYYLNNVKLLTEFFKEKNMLSNENINSPYIWIKCPNDMTSWEFFYYMLDNFMIVGTPGSGFGSAGEGYFRVTGFGLHEDTLEAIKRMKK